MSGLDSSDEAEEEEVTFVPISLGTADLQASLPDYLKVCAGNHCVPRVMRQAMVIHRASRPRNVASH